MVFMKFMHCRPGFVAFLACIFASMIVPSARSEPATVIVSDDGKSAELPARFLGLSYEASMVLSKDGRYYFNVHTKNFPAGEIRGPVVRE